MLGDWPNDEKLRLVLAALTCDLGTMLKSDGRETEALAVYDKSVETLDNPISQNALAWFLLTCNDSKLRDSERGLELAQKAAQARPEKTSYQNTLALAYYRNDKCDQVLLVAPVTEHLSHEDKSFRRVLQALALYELGDVTKARDQFNHVRKSIYDDQEVDATTQQLIDVADTLFGEAEEELPGRNDD